MSIELGLYFDKGRRSAAKLLTKDEARRIAGNVALEQLMAEADRLDREMLLVMTQAIAAALVRDAA